MTPNQVLLSNQFREQRQRIIVESQGIVSKAKEENRGFTSEDREKLDKMDKDIDQLTRDIEAAEKVERRLLEDPNTKPSRHSASAQEDPEVRKKEYTRAFNAYLRFGWTGITDSAREVLATNRAKWAQEALEHGDFADGSEEFRAQSVGTTTAGGYTVPEGFSGQLEASMKAFGGMREAATVFATDSGNDLPWPTYDDTSNVGELLAENTSAAEQDVTFGQIIFKAYKYSSKLVKVSIELLQDSAFDIGAELARVFGERIGRITNTHFTTGDNSSKPQGAATAAGTGVTAASATAITAGELIDLFHSVDPAYRSGPKVRFMLNDSTLKAVRKLKDDTGGSGLGNFLWMGGLGAGVPDTILGKPYIINQDVASIATTNKSVLFGDFSKYRIRDVRSFAVLRLNERFAEAGQVAFIAFSRHDGRMLDAGTDPVKALVQA